MLKRWPDQEKWWLRAQTEKLDDNFFFKFKKAYSIFLFYYFKAKDRNKLFSLIVLSKSNVHSGV